MVTPGVAKFGSYEFQLDSNAMVSDVRDLNSIPIRIEPDNSNAWHFLGVAYGREDDIGMAALSLAEEALSEGDKQLAAQQATRATQILKAGTPARLRAEDLKRLARRKDD